jgi:hypothetical protein
VAECFKCTFIGPTPAQGANEPVAACKKCSVFMCGNHGGRLTKTARFLCILCYSNILAHSALRGSGGGPPGGGGGGGGGGFAPDDDGGGGGVVEFSGRVQFELEAPHIAGPTEALRREWDGLVEEVLDRVERFPDDGGVRQEIAGIVDQHDLEDEAAADIRREVFAMGERASIEVRRARAADGIDERLAADAFGVATWAIGVELGQLPSPDQVALLSGDLVRFVVGYVAPAAAGLAASAPAPA